MSQQERPHPSLTGLSTLDEQITSGMRDSAYLMESDLDEGVSGDENRRRKALALTAFREREGKSNKPIGILKKAYDYERPVHLEPGQSSIRHEIQTVRGARKVGTLGFSHYTHDNVPGFTHTLKDASVDMEHQVKNYPKQLRAEIKPNRYNDPEIPPKRKPGVVRKKPVYEPELAVTTPEISSSLTKYRKHGLGRFLAKRVTYQEIPGYTPDPAGHAGGSQAPFVTPSGYIVKGALPPKPPPSAADIAVGGHFNHLSMADVLARAVHFHGKKGKPS